MGNEVSATLRLQVQEDVTPRMKAARGELQNLQKASDATKETVSGLFRELAGPAAGVGIGAGIGILIKDSAQAAAALQELNNKAQVVFGQAFPQANAQANALGASLHRSSDDILGTATNITMVAEGLGFTSQKAQAMSFDLTKLAVDFSKSFGGTQEQAVDAITLAMEGSTRGLRQYGVVLTDSTLQQYAHSKGIKDDTSEMSQAQKALLTYEYLMEKTTAIQNTATKNTGDLRDETAALTDTWNDFLQAAGSPILPGVTKVIAGITEVINDARVSLGGFIQDFKALGSLINVDTGNYFSGVADRFHQIFGGGEKINNVIDLSDSAFATPAGDSFQKVTDAALKADTNVKQLYGSLADPGKGSKQAADALKKVQDAMDQMGKSYTDTARSAEQKLIDLDSRHRDTMQSIRDEIGKTQNSIIDLEEQYRRSVDDMDNRDADAIIEAGKNVDELQKKLDEYNRKRESAVQNGGSVSVDLQRDIDETQKKLDAISTAQQKALDKAPDGVLEAFDNRADKTDLEKQLADSQEQRQRLKDDHDNRLGDLNAEMQKLNDKKAAEEKAYTAQRSQLELTKSALVDFTNTYAVNLQNVNKITQDTVDSMNKKLEELKATIASIDALMQANSGVTGGQTLEEKVNQRAAGRLSNVPKYGDGGIVTKPTLAIIGEKGPEKVVPLGKDQPQPVSITFGDIHISKEVDADAVIKKITRELQKIPLKAA
jgi:hypothetical protein